MMDLVPEGIVIPDSEFTSYTETDNAVHVKFTNGTSVEADILVGADGVRSGVSSQALGNPKLFHIDLRVWLAWCDTFGGLPPHLGRISHGYKRQASFFPMLHEGKPGYEWWIVEPVEENAPQPENIESYIRGILKDFADPLPRFPDHTDFSHQIFCWDIYNRPSIKKWSRGRVVFLGDAVHPVSPYAAYGMGMAIEDGHFIGKFLENANLEDVDSVSAAFQRYEDARVDYVNHQVEFARKMGNIFHQKSYLVAKFRDFFLDHTPFLQKMISKDYLKTAEDMSLSMQELHVK